MITDETVGRLEQPPQGDLRDRLPGLPGDLVRGVDHPVRVRVLHRRPVVGRRCRAGGCRWAADRPGGSCRRGGPAERAPHERPEPLVGRVPLAPAGTDPREVVPPLSAPLSYGLLTAAFLPDEAEADRPRRTRRRGGNAGGRGAVLWAVAESSSFN
ncbi:hypothetical protein GCM10010371_64760 [Streptomyces subrutilus]|uniref:Uncharacterized protein n=1 Tax=Streptomyces subrutilus TaxID=36818 RepID=A0A918RGH6_9ACTN|nr:hypothetical protein GCM10010371_64760 [Streptomyces subrutilus]